MRGFFVLKWIVNYNGLVLKKINYICILIIEIKIMKTSEKYFSDIDLQNNDIINLKADSLNINEFTASENEKRIVFFAGVYYYSNGISWIPFGGSLIQLNGNETWRGSTFNDDSITTENSGGVDLLVSGNKTKRQVASTSFATKNIRMGVTASTTSIGKYSGLKGSSLFWYLTGGFLFVGDFNISDTQIAVGTQNFWGLASSTNDLVIGGATTDEPSSLFNFIAIANDSTDANLQVMYNDSSGVATKIDLGSSFKSNRTINNAITTIYNCMLYNIPNSNYVIYKVTNKETGDVAQGIIATNLPDSTVGLNFFGIRTMGTTIGGITDSGQFDVYKLGVYSL